MLGVKQPQGEYRETDAMTQRRHAERGISAIESPCGRLLQFVFIVALGMASSPPGDR